MKVIGVGVPAEILRKGLKIKQFPGGEGANNCPRFWYVRDGFGCPFSCQYCYLQRFAHTHEHGAEVDPDVEGLYREVGAWFARPGPLGLIVGEVTDAWGWAKAKPWLLARNLRLMNLFQGWPDKTLIFLTKSHLVSSLLTAVPPAANVVLSWSLNAPAVAERYEMGRAQAQARLEDAQRCQEAGWRVRVRIDPMIPIDGWQAHYDQVAEQVAELVRPEQVTLGSWRPRTRDVLYQQAPPELRSLLEPGPDGRLRLSNRLALYRPTFARLRRGVAQLSLCKEELDVQAQLYAEFGIKEQACNCLGRAVEPVSAQGFPRRLPLLPMGRQDQFVPTPAA